MRDGVISRRLVLTGALAGGAALAVSGVARAAETTVIIKAEGGRDVKISIWPAVARQRGVILFSHGALSAPEKYLRLIDPWTNAGFKVLAPLHRDSTDHPDHTHLGMIESWSSRLLDMRALAAFANAPAYVAAGHSYGALVALTLGGVSAEIPPGVQPPLRDPRAKSVIAFSPPAPAPGLVTAKGFSTLAVPAFIETGDKDIPFGSKDGNWRVHLTAYDEAPAGDKYALVLEGADHYFGGLICRLDLPGPPQSEPLKRAIALATDFLEAYGAGDQTARKRLDAALSAKGPVQLSRK